MPAKSATSSSRSARSEQAKPKAKPGIMPKPRNTAAKPQRKTRAPAEAHALRPWLDHRRPAEERARLLVAAMSREEKIAQLLNEAPAIERLGVDPYNWWNECLHGVGRAGRATVFPQPIALAATFDADLVHRVATAISDEARAKHRLFSASNRRGIYQGLTFWTPNINIFRDPRWGRGHETYGECPWLTGTLGVAFITGLQGDDPKHLKLVATAKHFAVHSGPEAQRHTFDAQCDDRDLRLTYLPAFKMAVDCGVASIMGAYNRTNGEPCCGSQTLLTDVLRGEWGFTGYVVSDCGAINDFHKHHHLTADAAASGALALTNGCDLECGFGDDAPFRHLGQAIERGLCDDADLDTACVRGFSARFRLGMFDPPGTVSWSRIDPKVIDSAAHRELAREAARASIVLLKNDGVLPLAKNLRSIVVVGPNADAVDVLLGNYNGLNPRMVTVLEGLTGAVAADCQVQHFRGADLLHPAKTGFPAAVWTAEQADIVIAVVGLSPRIEGEEGEACLSDAAGDRTAIELPQIQLELLQAIKAKGKRLVVVLMNGGAVACPWLAEHADAVLTAWYPGEEGGTAVADVLFGDANPGGRLPVTFYRATSDLPEFADYRMSASPATATHPATPGRTYRYFTGEALWPFGHGLSYTTFAYQSASVQTRKDGDRTVKVTLRNTGSRAGDEVVQVYLRDEAASVPVPRHQLVAAARVPLDAGQRKTLTLEIAQEYFAIVDDEGRRKVEPGTFAVWVGGGQPDTGAAGLWTTVTVR
ncbi:glycosyl hydrolase [Planctomycetota bacterium]|nr:glycosyl hydrolase [Planctomycetota bacterium]